MDSEVIQEGEKVAAVFPVGFQKQLKDHFCTVMTHMPLYNIILTGLDYLHYLKVKILEPHAKPTEVYGKTALSLNWL